MDSTTSPNGAMPSDNPSAVQLVSREHRVSDEGGFGERGTTTNMTRRASHKPTEVGDAAMRPDHDKTR
jgi:hypothetical protein